MERKQITLRLPNEVYEALRGEASRRGYSVNELIIFALHTATVSLPKLNVLQ